MLKELSLNGTVICYDLQYKKVKNINLRIKSDGTVHVSANRYVSAKTVDEFLVSKSDFILKALEKYKNACKTPNKQFFSEDEICSVILRLCEESYPYFEKFGIKYPQIRFRKMVSRWGSCHPVRGVLTFNTNLMYAPKECIRYVVFHEFTHFLQSNHSKLFYEELEKAYPDWKKSGKTLKEISL